MSIACPSAGLAAASRAAKIVAFGCDRPPIRSWISGRERFGDVAAEIAVAADDEDAGYHEGFATMR